MILSDLREAAGGQLRDLGVEFLGGQDGLAAVLVFLSLIHISFVISRLAEKDLPEPGVPKISPLGFLSCLRSTMIMLLDSDTNLG